MVSRIEYYQDALIAQIIIEDNDSMVKNAQMPSVQGIIDGVKDYVLANISQENPTASVLSMLAPIGITKIVQVMTGGSWISYLFGILASVFRVDIANMIASICSGIKGLVSGGKQTSSDQVSDIIDNVVSSAASSPAELDAKSFDMQLRDAKLFKLALIDYRDSLEAKAIWPFGDKNKSTPKYRYPWETSISTTRTSGLKIFGSILKWMLLTILGTGGLLVIGDVVRKTLGLDNALDNTLQHGENKDKPSMSPNHTYRAAPKVVQTKYKLNPAYHDIIMNSDSKMWKEMIPNNLSSIENLVITFANEVYLGLENKDNEIRASVGFKGVVDSIENFNSSPGNRVVFIPPMFRTKRDIVDLFIEDLL